MSRLKAQNSTLFKSVFWRLKAQIIDLLLNILMQIIINKQENIIQINVLIYDCTNSPSIYRYSISDAVSATAMIAPGPM